MTKLMCLMGSFVQTGRPACMIASHWQLQSPDYLVSPIACTPASIFLGTPQFTNTHRGPSTWCLIGQTMEIHDAFQLALSALPSIITICNKCYGEQPQRDFFRIFADELLSLHLWLYRAGPTINVAGLSGLLGKLERICSVGLFPPDC